MTTFSLPVDLHCFAFSSWRTELSSLAGTSAVEGDRQPSTADDTQEKRKGFFIAGYQKRDCTSREQKFKVKA